MFQFIPANDNDSSIDSENGEISRSQRLGSAGSTGEGPPYPPDPPGPDELLKELSKKTDEALKKAIEDLSNYLNKIAWSLDQLEIINIIKARLIIGKMTRFSNHFPLVMRKPSKGFGGKPKNLCQGKNKGMPARND